jgi:hypothetical protein
VHGRRPGAVVGTDEDALHEPPVLLVERVVEAELLGHLLDLLGARRAPDVSRREVLRCRAGQARDQEEDRERHEADDEQQQYR